MRSVFADTSFFIAYLNHSDLQHLAAKQQMEQFRGKIVTSEWVFAELGNGLSQSVRRRDFAPFLAALRADPRFEVIAAHAESLQSGISLYHSRPDKQWSLTDCISFHEMHQRRIRDALTTDHHFRQAGFRVLL